MAHLFGSLTEPLKLWSRSEVLARPCPVPDEPGVYAWYIREVPDGVPADSCITHGDHTLIYVGISPKKPPANGASPSKQTLRKRLRYHYRGNASGSTLRLTLGCLLAEQLGIQLRRVGGGTRLTFADGEAKLSAWMAQNAFVVWAVHPQPWEPERELISRLSLPLNLDQNAEHPFHSTLSGLRKAARAEARRLPVLK